MKTTIITKPTTRKIIPIISLTILLTIVTISSLIMDIKAIHNKILNNQISQQTITKTIKNNTNNTNPNTNQNYYAIASGNGQTTQIYIKIPKTQDWQTYTIKSDFYGQGAKQVTTDKAITLSNYKSVKIVNMSDINYTTKDTNKNNNTIDKINTMIAEYRSIKG